LLSTQHLLISLLSSFQHFTAGEYIDYLSTVLPLLLDPLTPHPSTCQSTCSLLLRLFHKKYEVMLYFTSHSDENDRGNAQVVVQHLTTKIKDCLFESFNELIYAQCLKLKTTGNVGKLRLETLIMLNDLVTLLLSVRKQGEDNFPI